MRLAGAFAERGLAVDLVLGHGGQSPEPIGAGVRVVDLGARSFASGLPALARRPAEARAFAPALLQPRPPRVLGALPALVRHLERERIEALWSALDYSNLTALWARRLAGIPLRVVVSQHNSVSEKAELLATRRQRALPMLMRRFYPWADAVAAVSAGVADDLAAVAGLPRAALHVTHDPVPIAEVRHAARQETAHPWLAAPGPPVVLGVGRLKPQKDFATLVRAFARLRAEREARLLILGDGPERRALEALIRSLGIASDVGLPGHDANPWSAMVRAAVLAVSSRTEAFSLALVEAMACGLPAVATACHGPTEVLQNGAHGRLVPVGDDAALARALVETLAAPRDRAALRRRAEDFSVEKVAAASLDVLLVESWNS